MYSLIEIARIYDGSDGAKTQKLYDQLEALGAIGIVAVNLFRAQKSSARAKVYRGGVRGKGSFRGMAYDRKQWSMDNLCRVLQQHADALAIRWGWKVDPKAPVNVWVLYIDLPTGQVSFHTACRGTGPDYPAEWDGIPNMSPSRIIRWVEIVIAQMAVVASEDHTISAVE